MISPGDGDVGARYAAPWPRGCVFSLRQPGPKQRAAAARISANNDKEAADTQGADGYESFGTG